MIEETDPIIDFADQADGSFVVKQASGAEQKFPAAMRPRVLEIVKKNNDAMRISQSPPAAVSVDQKPGDLPPAPSAPVAPTPVVAPPSPDTEFAPGLSTSGASGKVSSGTTDSGFAPETVDKLDVQQGEAQEATTARDNAATLLAAETMKAERNKAAFQNEQDRASIIRNQEAILEGEKAAAAERQKYEDMKRSPIVTEKVFGGKNLALGFALGIGQAIANAMKVRAGQAPNVRVIEGLIQRNVQEMTRRRNLDLGDSKEAQDRLTKEIHDHRQVVGESTLRLMKRQLAGMPPGQEAANLQLLIAESEKKLEDGQLKYEFQVGEKRKTTVSEEQSIQSKAATGTGKKDFGESAFPEGQASAEVLDKELNIRAQKNGTSYESERKRYEDTIKAYRPLMVQVKKGEALQNILSGATEGNDVGGFGRLAKFASNEWMSDEAVLLRQNMTAEFAKYMQRLSGAAVSPEELKRMQNTIIGSGSMKEMKEGLRIMFADANATAATFRNDPNNFYVKVYDDAQSTGAAATQEKGSAKQSQIDAQKAASAPPKSKAQKARSKGDIVRSKKRQLAEKMKDKNNAPRIAAAKTLDELGSSGDDTPEEAKLRKEAEAQLSKAAQRPIHDSLKARGGTRAGGGRF